jgi:chemotaxis protein CheD
MATATANKTANHTAVGIGQAVMAAEPALLTTILGSCIAVALYTPRFRMGMLSHVVLPHSTGATTYPAKFADTAVSHMLSVLHNHGVKPAGLVAKIAGGACMFGDGKFMQIGDANIQATIQALADANIPLVGKNVGGTIGRRICFDLASGLITVECLGHPLQTI